MNSTRIFDSEALRQHFLLDPQDTTNRILMSTILVTKKISETYDKPRCPIVVPISVSNKGYRLKLEQCESSLLPERTQE
ncbi:hypothetical protein RI543_003509 [Arxiozyma heterogenica]|uniref:Uncharacterized protein n=1 Tax=Arxiozyma heterogenica TaxID=278026 RepID=A0AAN7WQG4_9SACH|nr:hypothetical protein RI543_003509 [Kazachstania heterogenica]